MKKKNNIVTVRENAEHLKPYEKFQAYGPEQLTDAELLAIILRTGTKNMDALEVAGQVLRESDCGKNGLLGLYHMSLEQLSKIHGIGPVKAVKLKCITELSRRIAATKAWNELVFQRSSTVAAYYMEKLRHLSRECVILMLLDSKGHLIKEVELSTGTVSMSPLSPREVFIAALKAEAVKMILIHNHPSGDPTPSGEDVRITEILHQLGLQMDLPLIDHIIIGDKDYISFKEKGLL